MFRLSISNIGWKQENDEAVYSLMQKIGFSGLEIAPTRIFPTNPYEQNIQAVQAWVRDLWDMYKLTISSMQSIWYGKSEKIFGSELERQELIFYTKKAIDFAEAIGCKNIVFGCPKNRAIPEQLSGKDSNNIAVNFFHDIGEYAREHSTIIGMEANPVIYGTNYINTTEEAIDLIKRVNSEGFKLNLDIGTMIYNNEDLSVLDDNVSLINHVHISEPNLASVERHSLHSELSKLLSRNGYEKYISIEAKSTEDLGVLENEMLYVKEIFS